MPTMWTLIHQVITQLSQIIQMTLFTSTASTPYEVVMEINGQNVQMKIDTGAAVSIFSSKLQQALLPIATISEA